MEKFRMNEAKLKETKYSRMTAWNVRMPRGHHFSFHFLLRGHHKTREEVVTSNCIFFLPLIGSIFSVDVGKKNVQKIP